MQDIDFILKEKFSFTERRVCWVYFLIYCNEIVYVWQSTDCFSRIMSHRNWFVSKTNNLPAPVKIFDSVYIHKIPEVCLRDTEEYYIAKFNPKYNRTKHLHIEPKNIIKIQQEEDYFEIWNIQLL
jgi:hypothetical protein